jgi:hypothetical protein
VSVSRIRPGSKSSIFPQTFQSLHFFVFKPCSIPYMVFL